MIWKSYSIVPLFEKIFFIFSFLNFLKQLLSNLFSSIRLFIFAGNLHIIIPVELEVSNSGNSIVNKCLTNNEKPLFLYSKVGQKAFSSSPGKSNSIENDDSSFSKKLSGQSWLVVFDKIWLIFSFELSPLLPGFSKLWNWVTL